MDLQLAYISPRRDLKSAGCRALVEDYVKRAQRFNPVALAPFRSEVALLEGLARAGRREPVLVLLDSRGTALNSPQVADLLGRQRDEGAQQLVLAVGPADGWSNAARTRAQLLLSFGAITLPHEMALAVLSEQVYRALTILAGHPYHGGHE